MASNAADRRAAVRLEHPVLVAYQSVNRYLSDVGTSLSRTGVFVNTARPLPVGTKVRLLVSLPDDSLPCEVTGHVIRVQDGMGNCPPGMGIKFVHSTDETEGRISRLVDRLRHQLGQDDSE